MIKEFLHQLVALLEPVGLVWFALILLAVALWWKRQRGFAAFAAAVVVFITIIGSTPVPDRILASLERPYAGRSPESLPTADAIVILGAGACPSRYEIQGLHITAAGDRIIMGHALFKMGKAPVILLGGNALDLSDKKIRECDIIHNLLVSWGLPAEAVIPLGENGDTHDEALNTRKITKERGWNRILLVTSANHMRRSAAVFRAQGLEITEAPCNFLTSVSLPTAPLRPSVPRYEGFVQMATWLHEVIGWQMYRRRGWITE